MKYAALYLMWLCFMSLICMLADIFDVSLDQLVLTDLSAHSDIIAAGTEPRHYAAVPNKSLIPLSGANAKSIMDFLSFPEETQLEIREYIRFKKYLLAKEQK